MNIPTGDADNSYTVSPDDVSFRLVTGPTLEQLSEISPRHVQATRTSKQSTSVGSSTSAKPQTEERDMPKKPSSRSA